MGIHHLARRIEKTRLGPLCRVHGPSKGPWLLSLLPLERRRTPPPERQHPRRRRQNPGRLQSGSHRKTKRQQGRQSHLRSGRDAGGNPSFHGGKPEQAHVHLFFHQPSPRPGRYSSGRKHVRGLDRYGISFTRISGGCIFALSVFGIRRGLQTQYHFYLRG